MIEKLIYMNEKLSNTHDEYRKVKKFIKITGNHFKNFNSSMQKTVMLMKTDSIIHSKVETILTNCFISMKEYLMHISNQVEICKQIHSLMKQEGNNIKRFKK